MLTELSLLRIQEFQINIKKGYHVQIKTEARFHLQNSGPLSVFSCASESGQGRSPQNNVGPRREGKIDNYPVYNALYNVMTLYPSCNWELLAPAFPQSRGLQAALS